jgi:hypothetical protein
VDQQLCDASWNVVLKLAEQAPWASAFGKQHGVSLARFDAVLVFGV